MVNFATLNLASWRAGEFPLAGQIEEGSRVERYGAMKLLILSDVHGNWPALRAVLDAEPERDAILFLGDLVDYGAHPVDCVTWAMNLGPGNWIVQGNHDFALARRADPHCSMAYSLLARSTQRVTEPLMGAEMKEFLGALPAILSLELDGAKCVACHATPKDPLHHYLSEGSSLNVWESELEAARHPHFLFVGHTHVPMKSRIRKTLVLNPGSVGQPRDGDPRAAYAVWHDGQVFLRRSAYDLEKTMQAYGKLPLEPAVTRALCEVLRSGGNLPAEPAWNGLQRALR